MKTGMFTCGHQRLPIEHAFRDASELGYDGIEIGAVARTRRAGLKSGRHQTNQGSGADVSDADYRLYARNQRLSV